MRNSAAQLGLGSYKSAWLLCAKLRRAMVAPGRAPLAGLIEVDEAEIPLRTKADPVCGGGRSPQGKDGLLLADEDHKPLAADDAAVAAVDWKRISGI